MAVKKQKSKQKSEKSSPSGRPRESARGAAPRGVVNPEGGRRTRDDADPVVDERAIARRNLKPRSPRESVKGPSERKASPSGKSAKR